VTGKGGGGTTETDHRREKTPKGAKGRAFWERKEKKDRKRGKAQHTIFQLGGFFPAQGTITGQKDKQKNNGGKREDHPGGREKFLGGKKRLKGEETCLKKGE